MIDINRRLRKNSVFSMKKSLLSSSNNIIIEIKKLCSSKVVFNKYYKIENIHLKTNNKYEIIIIF